MFGMNMTVVVSSDTPELNDVVIGVACHCTARQWTAK